MPPGQCKLQVLEGKEGLTERSLNSLESPNAGSRSCRRTSKPLFETTMIDALQQMLVVLAMRAAPVEKSGAELEVEAEEVEIHKVCSQK